MLISIFTITWDKLISPSCRNKIRGKCQVAIKIIGRKETDKNKTKWKITKRLTKLFNTLKRKVNVKVHEHHVRYLDIEN